jgi:hypothetical protein
MTAVRDSRSCLMRDDADRAADVRVPRIPRRRVGGARAIGRRRGGGRNGGETGAQLSVWAAPVGSTKPTRLTGTRAGEGRAVHGSAAGGRAAGGGAAEGGLAGARLTGVGLVPGVWS